MAFVKTRDGTDIFYRDWGSGQPLVFHHGWPLSGDDWDTQMLYFLDKGYRVVAHDRRGHGRSAQVSDGHDMDHYAADIAAVAMLKCSSDPILTGLGCRLLLQIHDELIFEVIEGGARHNPLSYLP